MGITDADRERVVRDLTRHCGDGRLTLDELEERIAEAYAADTVTDLDHALRHLPAPPRPMSVSARAVPPTPPARHPAITPSKGAEIALRVHAYTYLSVMAFLVAIWFLTSPFGSFWPIWPGLGWGLAITIHAGVTKAVTTGRRELDR